MPSPYEAHFLHKWLIKLQMISTPPQIVQLTSLPIDLPPCSVTTRRITSNGIPLSS